MFYVIEHIFGLSEIRHRGLDRLGSPMICYIISFQIPNNYNKFLVVYKSPVYEAKAFELVLERLVSIGYPKVKPMFWVEHSNCALLINYGDGNIGLNGWSTCC